MKIKSKIILSNILMVGIPILTAGVIGLIGWHQIDSKYIYSLETMFKDENAVVSAQSSIYAYQEELWNTNWEQMEEEEIGHQDEEDESNIKWSELKNEKNELTQTSKMYNLGQEMENMGYHFSVFMNGDCQYSNFTGEDQTVLQEIAGDAITHVRSMVVGEDNASVIKSSFEKGDVICVIIAVNSGNEIQSENGISYLKQYILRFVLLFLLIIIAVIFLTNMILSRFIAKLILPPMSMLQEGTRHITEGDLDTPIRYKNKDEIGEVCEDFEEMRAYLKQSALERLEYEAYRRELISGISHDLRTPLTSIKGYLEGLTKGIANNKEMQERYYHAMFIRTNDLERLVDNLSVYNKLENHTLQYDRQRFDLSAFLDSYLGDRSLELQKNQINIRINAREGEYPVFLDRLQLTRVFDNFVSNTLKYRTQEKSLVFITIDSMENKIICMYEDDAGGVPAESLPRLFDSFYRVDDARCKAGEGSGLGLAIVKEIITGQGGCIYAENGDTGLKIIMEIGRVEDEDESINCGR